ncbi:hypothetical protein [Myxococcus landrumensis]|uniref:Lipoprotein n=1 Tax=Myxococcus landrumensis TaxID=2813577 RepID=A0ABX7N0U3_9BACT|nr:hypothetical protein [Myxococcus landrumus]QSQ12213.1 hypothetical protein JY572_28130 [Myxococcus landrumus]
MYRIAVAALIVAAAGCATTGGAGSREGNATVTGVIRLPETGFTQAQDACEQIRVVVAPAANASDALGKAMVKASRGNRCSFTVAGIPSNTDIQANAVADAALKCANGAAPTIAPASATAQPTFKLSDYGTSTRDFVVSCG